MSLLRGWSVGLTHRSNPQHSVLPEIDNTANELHVLDCAPPCPPRIKIPPSCIPHPGGAAPLPIGRLHAPAPDPQRAAPGGLWGTHCNKEERFNAGGDFYDSDAAARKGPFMFSTSSR